MSRAREVVLVYAGGDGGLVRDSAGERRRVRAYPSPAFRVCARDSARGQRVVKPDEARGRRRDHDVYYQALPLPVADQRPDDVRDVHEERLVRLDVGVAVNLDGEGVGRAARGDGLPREALRDVVAGRGRRRAVGGRDVEAHAPGGRGRVEADGEVEVRRARVALGLRHVVDGDGARDIVVLDGALPLPVRDGRARDVRDVDGE